MRILPWFLAAPALDVHLWVLLASGHTARHTLQIDEVKRSPGFPAADR